MKNVIQLFGNGLFQFNQAVLHVLKKLNVKVDFEGTTSGGVYNYLGLNENGETSFTMVLSHREHYAFLNSALEFEGFRKTGEIISK